MSGINGFVVLVHLAHGRGRQYLLDIAKRTRIGDPLGSGYGKGDGQAISSEYSNGRSVFFSVEPDKDYWSSGKKEDLDLQVDVIKLASAGAF